MTTTDCQIAELKPGQSIRVSGDATCWCTVERSGDGHQLRWVRHTAKGFRVFYRERVGA